MDALTVKPSIIKTNEPVTTETPDLSSLIPNFLAELDIVPSSKSTYQTALNGFFKFLMDKNITFPNRADLLRYKEELCQNHSAKTVNLQLSVLRSFFTWTQFNRLYPNISYGIKGVRIDRSPKRYDLSSSQISGILSNINTDNLCGRQRYALVLLASTAALRVGEISSLNVGDLQVLKDTPILRIKGKGYQDKGQIVQIGKHTDEALRAALSLRDTVSPDDPMFVSTSNFSKKGERITAKGIGKILRQILRENNYNGKMYTAHSFRHSGCCLALEVTGQNLLDVKKFMRHQNLETTMVYADHGEFLAQNIASQIEDKLL